MSLCDILPEPPKGGFLEWTQSSLIELVAEMAKASATGDPRFFADPVTPDELKDLDIEISVLSPLQRTDNPLNLRLGVDGIYI